MMSNEAVMLDMALMGSDLSPAARSVLNCLVKFSDKARACFPAVATIVEKCGYCERTVRNKIKELAKKGWITKQEQYRNNGSQTSNYYIINLTQMIEPDQENDQQTVPSAEKIEASCEVTFDFAAVVQLVVQAEETTEQGLAVTRDNGDIEQTSKSEPITETITDCSQPEDLTQDGSSEKSDDIAVVSATPKRQETVDCGQLLEQDRLGHFKQYRLIDSQKSEKLTLMPRKRYTKKQIRRYINKFPNFIRLYKLVRYPTRATTATLVRDDGY